MIQLSFSTLLRAAALLAACALVGCGGASSTVDPLVPTRVIAFGDSLSDTSPAPLLGLPNGSGEFTVQTGDTDNTLAGRLAAKYGFVLNNGSTTSGGYSYADGTLNSGKVSDVGNQISTYLGHVGNSIGAKDLIIISVGSQDIYYAAPTNNTSALATAATNLTSYIQRLTNAGAKYVLVVLPINMARTPWGLSGVNATSIVIQGLSYDTSNQCLSFSCQLSTKLNAAYPATSSHQPILLADLMSYSNLFTGTIATGNADTYVSYGVTNPNTAACNAPANLGTAGCASGAASVNYGTYVFADNLNLTPFGNRLLADYIYNYNFYRAGWR
jgi:phospholipase/lecithinase/hemolysin